MSRLISVDRANQILVISMAVTMTVIVIVAMAVPVALVVIIAVFVPAIVAAVIMPVIAVFILVAIADDPLVVASPEAGISNPIIAIMKPWLWLIDHHLVAVVDIIIAITVRQISLMYPSAVVQVNVLMNRNIIINANVGHVIIIGMVIAHGPPCGLHAYVYAHA